MPVTDKELSDREFLEGLAGQVDKLTTELTERLDHMDDLIHDTERQVRQIRDFIDEHRPALARGLALMGGGLGGWIGKRKGQADG